MFTQKLAYSYGNCKQPLTHIQQDNRHNIRVEFTKTEYTTAKHLHYTRSSSYLNICLYEDVCVALLSRFWRSPTSATRHNFQTIRIYIGTGGVEGYLYARKCLWHTT